MTKRIQCKHKIERRYGVALWGQASSPVHVRSYGPGQHGAKGKMGKTSAYGQQLAAKQKLKGYYGNIGERHFRRLYLEAVRRKGNTGDNLVTLLECRLDAVVYRMKWAPTVFAARQFVNHKHVLVNDRVVNIASYRLRANDVVTLRDGMRQTAVVMGSMASTERDLPEYLQASSSGFVGTLVALPEMGKVPYPIVMNINSVVEYYSR
jgi:small subunit ribosomal protein S4